jgi:hypothetical protein
MANDRRDSYTPDGLKAMKWRITREAIDRDIQQAVFADGQMVCFRGSLEEGYRISFDHYANVHDQENEPGYGDPPSSLTHYYLPPIPSEPEPGEGTVYLEDYHGDRSPTSLNAWGEPAHTETFEIQGYYRKWAHRVDQVFVGWDNVDRIPDERNFWDAAGRLREAIRPLESMNVPGESYHTACRTLGLVKHDPGAQGTTPPERMWAPQINGPIDRFVIPLQGTILNLFVLGELLAAQLDGMGKMWQNARASVMDIGWHGAEKMADHKAGFDPQVVIKSAGWVVGATGLITMPATAAIGLAATGLVLAGAEEVLDAIKRAGKDVVDRESVLGGGTAEEILRSIESVLTTDQTNGLEPQVQIDESDAIDMLRVAQYHIDNEHAVYDAEAKTYKTCFTMEVSDVRTDSAPDKKQDIDIDVEFGRLRTAGRVFADELAEELRGISRGVQEVFSTSSAWERPELHGGVAIGIGLTGPWEDWSLVRDNLAHILDKTATQVVEVGEYLISAANFLERQDASAKAAMDKVAKDLDNVFRSDI